MDVSIVIVNWNTREWLARCLRSICTSTIWKLSFEVFVVDNDSKDGSAEMVRRSFPAVRLIANAENTGFINGCNQGMQASQARYVLLLNSDTEMLPSAINDLVAFMDEHPEAGAAGPMILNPDGSRQASGGDYNTPLTLFLSSSGLLMTILSRQSRLGRCIRAQMDFSSVKPVGWLSNACLIVRREVIKQVGLLDNQYVIYCSDCDWGYRIAHAGWKIYYAPHIRVIHYGGCSIRNITKVNLHNYAMDMNYWDNYRFMEKFWGKGRKRMGKLAVLGGALIQMTGWMVVRLFKVGRSWQLAPQEIELCQHIIRTTLLGPVQEMPWMRKVSSGNEANAG